MSNISDKPRAVEEQVILPWPVAIRITLRGLKIRLGRSLITMSGVVLGIAFLMSVLTGEALRSGLEHETRTKTEVRRLLKLIEDEIGTFKGRKLAVLVSGPLVDDHRLRLVRLIAARCDAHAITVMQTKPDALEAVTLSTLAGFDGSAFTFVQSKEELVKGAHVLMLLDETLPKLDDTQLSKLLGAMHQPVILDYFYGRYNEESLRKKNKHALYTSLSYAMTEEEIAQRAKKILQKRKRQIWITIVSMLVTVISISNAMLMSVTERFREIGTMKCLGALSGFVVKLFLIESFVVGTLGAIVGTALGFFVPFVAYMFSAGTSLLIASTPFTQLLLAGLVSAVSGTVLSIVAAIYPAVVAAKMMPADALRTDV
ncbi:MAG: hypothetical protein KAI66_10790 [Lentisphaeria bacterium]|nr:hypothetical protein [Lentisphaeria bacterium]